MHPEVRLVQEPGARKVEIVTRSGARFVFETTGPSVGIEESVFFAAPEGARKCEQIVVAGRASPNATLCWSFTLVDE
jgi:uncharacterized heparinase superfamily protein